MYSLPFLVAQFYPDKSTEEKQQIVERIVQGAESYYADNWKEVKMQDLSTDHVKDSLLQTMYETQNAYRGVVDEILRSFYNWSDGTLVIPSLQLSSDQMWYRKFYSFYGFLHFADIEIERQVHLLAGDYVTLAAVWGVELYTSIQDYFANKTDLVLMKKNAEGFSVALSSNPSVIGAENSVHHTVAEWIDKFAGFDNTDYAGRVDHFMEENFEVQRLEEPHKSILSTVLTVFWGLLGGYIWREIDTYPVGGYELKEVSDGKTLEQRYLEMIVTAKPEQMMDWLKSYTDVADWIMATNKSEQFVRNLFYILETKIDLDDPEQSRYLLKLIHELSELGLESIEEIIYFDEKEQGFVWNENVVAPEDQLLKELANVKTLTAKSGGKKGKKDGSDEYKKLKDSLAK